MHSDQLPEGKSSPSSSLKESTARRFRPHIRVLDKTMKQCCSPSFIASFAALLLMTGCGRHIGPEVHPVRGIVTLDGDPLEAATVGFTPVDSSTGLPATGVTDAEGVYTLTTVQGGKPGGGAMIGDYLVTIDKISVEEQPPRSRKPSAPGSEPAPPPTPMFRSLIPEAYGRRTTSGLRVTVDRGSNSGPEFNFSLRKDFPGAR